MQSLMEQILTDTSLRSEEQLTLEAIHQAEYGDAWSPEG